MEKEKKQVGQLLTKTFSERGGGERVSHALFQSFNASLFTFVQRIKGAEIVEIGSEADRRLGMKACPK